MQTTKIISKNYPDVVFIIERDDEGHIVNTWATKYNATPIGEQE